MNRITLYWILGYMDVDGNESADEFSGKIAENNIGPEPLLGLLLSELRMSLGIEKESSISGC